MCLSNLDEVEDAETQKRLIMNTAGNFFVGASNTVHFPPYSRGRSLYLPRVNQAVPTRPWPP